MLSKKSIRLVGQRQQRVRSRKSYSKERFARELIKCDWAIPKWEGKRQSKKVRILEDMIRRLTSNLNQSLDKIAPIKTVNFRREKKNPVLFPWEKKGLVL